LYYLLSAPFLGSSSLHNFRYGIDARDVYYHGEVIKQNMMTKKYNGYEIGIYFFVDGHTVKTIITSIWKRERW
jgi:hypothetical protein